MYCWSFPGGSGRKESACNVGDPGSVPGSGRSPGKDNGNTPVFLPGEFHGPRSLVAYSPWGRKDLDTTKWLSPYILQRLMMALFNSHFQLNTVTSGNRKLHSHTHLVSRLVKHQFWCADESLQSHGSIHRHIHLLRSPHKTLVKGEWPMAPSGFLVQHPIRSPLLLLLLLLLSRFSSIWLCVTP